MCFLNAGEYLIGERTTHSYHVIDWYKLHPKTKSGKYWHSDWYNPDTGRSGMGLHPGSVSEGKYHALRIFLGPSFITSGYETECNM